MKVVPMDFQTVFILLMIGLAAGMLSGLVGVGGGIVLVPALVYFLGYSQHQAQGTSLGILTIPVTLLAFLVYYNDCVKNGDPIQFNVIWIVGLGFIIGGLFGGKIAVKINEELLKRIFAVILFYTGIKMLHWDELLLKWFKSIFS